MKIDTEIEFLLFIPITSHLFSVQLYSCITEEKKRVFSTEYVEILFTETVSHILAYKIGNYMY